MASYKQFEETNNVFIEQNIWDNNEVTSYDATIETSNGVKTTALTCYQTNEGKRLYSLGLLENLDLDTVKVVSDDLSNVFKFKTAKVRRKHLFNMIRANEMALAEQ